MHTLCIPSPKGVQETSCLALRLINGWLFGISSGSVKDPAVRERVITYQRECYDVLADHSLGARGAPQPDPDEIRAEPEGAGRSLRQREHELEQVKTMYRLKGADHALELYKHFGFPMPTPPAVTTAPPTPLAAAVLALVQSHAGRWFGTPAALLVELGAIAPEAAARPDWPRTPSALGTALQRIAGELKRRRVKLHKGHSGIRSYTIEL